MGDDANSAIGRADGGYLDYASGAPLHPVARTLLLEAYDQGWPDPGRLYAAGRRARMLLDDARERVATLLGARPDELRFTSSGAHANHLGLTGALAARERVGRHLVASAVEHSSVLAVAANNESAGGSATLVPVSREGQVDLAALEDALRPDTAVVSVQSANHEVGTVQPLGRVAEYCARHGVPLHVDAAQSVGHVDVRDLPYDLLTASAHKWGGPLGVGVLVVRKGVRWRAPHLDAPSEHLPPVLAAAAALEAQCAELAAEGPRLSHLVDRIRAEIPRRVTDVEVVGHPTERLPHLVTFSCLYVDGEALLTALDVAGFAVSSGSSCTASTLRPSHVLEAMGVLTHGNVRVSVGRDTTDEDVARFLDAVPEIVTRLRRLAAIDES